MTTKPHAKLVLIVVSLIFASQAYCGDIEPGNRMSVPDLKWQDSDGNTHHLKDSSGKPRILHFWAAWCIPCREEMPQLMQWRNDNPDIEVICLSLDKRMSQTKYFINKHQLTMPALLLDEDDADKLDITVVPYTIFVSPDNLFFGQMFGIADWENQSFTQQVYQQFGITAQSARLSSSQ